MSGPAVGLLFLVSGGRGKGMILSVITNSGGTSIIADTAVPPWVLADEEGIGKDYTGGLWLRPGGVESLYIIHPECYGPGLLFWFRKRVGYEYPTREDLIRAFTPDRMPGPAQEPSVLRRLRYARSLPIDRLCLPTRDEEPAPEVRQALALRVPPRFPSRAEERDLGTRLILLARFIEAGQSLPEFEEDEYPELRELAAQLAADH